jgi:hypothetical protein
MTDNDKALVERLRVQKTVDEMTPNELDKADFIYGHEMCVVDGRQAADRIEAQAAEIERLREALRLSNEAHWFYLGDDCSSDQCRFSIDECIDEDFEWDNRPQGNHVLQISGAKPVPDMWVALHYFTDAEKDERGEDNPYDYTVHATEEAARAALGDTK